MVSGSFGFGGVAPLVDNKGGKGFDKVLTTACGGFWINQATRSLSKHRSARELSVGASDDPLCWW